MQGCSSLIQHEQQQENQYGGQVLLGLMQQESLFNAHLTLVFNEIGVFLFYGKSAIIGKTDMSN